MTGPNNEQCSLCYFSSPLLLEDDDPPQEYFCRRFPPVNPPPEHDAYDANMPIQVMASCWCGEFKAKGQPVSEPPQE